MSSEITDEFAEAIRLSHMPTHNRKTKTMIVAQRIKVQYPTYPSLSDFESVVDKAVKPGIYRETFIRMFFDEMSKRRMNCNMDGAIREVALKAAHALSDAYAANVSFEGAPSDIPSPTFWNVAGFIEHAIIGETSFAGVIESEISARLFELWARYNHDRGEFDDLFEYDKDDIAIDVCRTWLDYIELLKETAEYKSLVSLRRDLTILCRCYELLVTHFATNTSR